MPKDVIDEIFTKEDEVQKLSGLHKYREVSGKIEQGIRLKDQEIESLKLSHQMLNKELHELKENHEHKVTFLHEREQELAEKERDISDVSRELEELQLQMQEHDLLFEQEYQARHAYYQQFLNSDYEESKQICKVFKDRKYKGIIVYPAAVHWEPVQRPQHFLIEMAKKGYLCFFCTSNNEPFSIKKLQTNLYIINREEYLLAAVQSLHILVLNTWLMQNAWIDCLSNKTIWYDILDRVDFFSLYDKRMLLKHYEVLSEASIVTYSAKKLEEYLFFRQDAIYLPNAVRREDFRAPESASTIPPELKKLIGKGKKIIGYFGAIEEWFDTEFVNEIAAHENVEIVLIGHCNIDKNKLTNHVHLLGPRPYHTLMNYAQFFDASIIPFKVNDLTNSVSPVKFFEYCAIGKPIISSAISEVVSFSGPGVHIVHNVEQLHNVDEMLVCTVDAKKHLQQIAIENSWEERIEQTEKVILNKLDNAYIFANDTLIRSMAVFAATFFDYDGDNYYSGGAERYLVDLHEVCEEMGFNLKIYQYGHYPWYRKYKDIEVYSLGHKNLDIKLFTMEVLTKFSYAYKWAAEERFYMNFYSAFFQSFPQVVHPSIGISHGVAWDNEYCNYSNGAEFWSVNERFIEGAKNVQKLISVDTNTPNWFQTVLYDQAQQMITIPNYVNHDEFYPDPTPSDKLRIVYPRRLYKARGLYLVLDIMDTLFSSYDHVEIHLIGKGFEEDVQAIKEKQEQWPGRVHCYHKDPDQMHEVYKNADITLIPTLYSEGTSLSCLEACASGNAVISTRIGGLTDIIIDKFNGLLISPTTEELLEAIIQLIEDEPLRTRLGRNAIEVSKAFSKSYWKDQWKKVIKNIIEAQTVNDTEDIDANKNKLKNKGIEVFKKKNIEIRVLDLLQAQEIAETINYYLQTGYDVFVRCDHLVDQHKSFGRLQFINKQTELAFQPDQILNLINEPVPL
jgi:glycosyltransferase involved in cell wall biosynthesis